MPNRQDRQEQWAVFWCMLLSPLLYGEVPPEEAGRFLNELAATEHLFPDGTRRRPSRATLWRKWKQYRQGGFEALFRKRRSDRGRARKATSAMIAKAIELKTEQPYRSHVPINQFLADQFHTTIPKSTLYRHLKRAGATRRKLGISRQKVRRRWTRDYSNALWLGDFYDGPYVLWEDRAVPTYLSAFIDCHSRYVVEARYYLRENFDILTDSLLRAWSVHGASGGLYLDNAKIYHANALKAACFALNIRLLHRPPRDAAPGGLIEQFFRTVKSQFESEVRAGDILTLDQLNRALAAWLDQSYHREPNSETKQPPGERYHQGKRFTRHVNLQEVIKYFLHRRRRMVREEFSDVQVDGRFFQVDPGLRGDRVEVRYDPFGPFDTVLIYSLDGEYLGVGTRHERETAPDQPPPQPRPKPKHNYLDLLIRNHEQALHDRHAGIDYPAVLAAAGRRWPFAEFAKQLATLLGRAGGLAALSAEELESLQKVYNRLTCLDAPMLREACERAVRRTIPEIVFVLQQLSHERQRRT
ncbi:MAG: Mu transposase C-terminal domain-containing protein [Thermoguttaceae bacterium]|nr:Mu transposase C-terminal domain-containing protein [Planctomycetota bacterium]MDY0171097.1 Mu transposase C-terminal domain-containing protein [Thermoguttaceae bacterium]